MVDKIKIMESNITIAIYIHAFFGGIGLLAGTLSFIVRKGSKVHTLSGKCFSFAMITSSLISMPLACMPGHENTFLFLIALFTIYMVLAGNRALSFKPRFKKIKADLSDNLISGSMLVFSVVMIVFGIYGLLNKLPNAVLYVFFGVIGLFMSWRDFVFYKNPSKTKSTWLVNHIGRIVGAYIASITAFLVAGLHLGTLVYWIGPTVLGSIAIVYWVRKVKRGTWARPQKVVN